MAVLLISDLHLEDSRPEIMALFERFLEQQAVTAEALYILGDLFEYWIGDDALTPTARRVATALGALSGSGLPCYFMHGNRDFLIGEAFAHRAGLELLQDPVVVDFFGTATLLLHGDTLCTDDVEYQAIRSQVRDPAWQAQCLAMSVEQRLTMAQQARDASNAHTGQVAMEIMDVNAGAVTKAFKDYGIHRIIHGHTHRPNIHNYAIDGVAAQRIVLGDWYRQGSVLRITPQDLSLDTLPLSPD